MEKHNYLYISILFLILVRIHHIICMNTKDIHLEKEILKKIENLAKERLTQIKRYEEEYSYSQVLNSAEKFCGYPSKINDSQLENSNISCIKLIRPTGSSHTQIKVKDIINFPKTIQQESIIDFFTLNLKSKISSDPDENRDIRISTNILILVLTKNSISIINHKGTILIQQPLKFKIDIIKADFSQFEEDNSIILYSSNSEISIITLEMNISFDYSNSIHSVNLFIPSRKYTNLNVNSNLTYITSNIFNSNKYVVASYDSGEVIVMNKEFEIKSIINLYRKIKRLIINNGMIGVISENDLIFVNLLGGNSILLICSSYYYIMDSVYDNVNNLLFLIDERMNLLVYQIKLSISKQSFNECQVIYRIKLRYDMKNFNVRMNYVQNSIYIFIGSDYGAVIDLVKIQELGINKALNEYFIVQTENNKEFYDLDKVIVGILPDKSSKTYSKNQNINEKITNHILIYFGSGLCALIELENTNKNYVEKNKNAQSDSIWMNVYNYLNSNIIYVYIILIFIISCCVIYYRRSSIYKQPNHTNSSADNSKSFTTEEEHILREIIKNMKNFKSENIGSLEKNNISEKINKSTINNKKKTFSID